MVESYVADITKALENKCWFSALALSLALPDICSAAEYPDETSTAKRYIEWFDKYPGDYFADDDKAPFINGEVVYNLRNTFLHSGNATIDSNRVKEERNQLDQFLLILGDGTKIWSMSGLFGYPVVNCRTMVVDVTYLCRTICAFSQIYYRQNPDKFHFDHAVVAQEEIHDLSDVLTPMYRLANQKLERMGQTVRFQETPGVPISEREAQIRFFVFQYFEEEYGQKTEQIVQAVLRSETKQQVNNALMRSFPSKETGEIYKRLSPLIEFLPDK